MKRRTESFVPCVIALVGCIFAAAAYLVAWLPEMLSDEVVRTETLATIKIVLAGSMCATYGLFVPAATEVVNDWAGCLYVRCCHIITYCACAGCFVDLVQRELAGVDWSAWCMTTFHMATSDAYSLAAAVLTVAFCCYRFLTPHGRQDLLHRLYRRRTTESEGG